MLALDHIRAELADQTASVSGPRRAGGVSPPARVVSVRKTVALSVRMPNRLARKKIAPGRPDAILIGRHQVLRRPTVADG
jgi:hypothetical protein